MPRPRTPLASAQASGAADHNPKRFADRVEPVARGPLGPLPNYFNDLQRDQWNELIARMPEGVLVSGDEYIVELTVLLLMRMRSFEDPLKPVEIGHLRACLGSLGLTPADRTRVNGSHESKKEDDPLAALFGGSGSGHAPNCAGRRCRSHLETADG